jgi:hypothetical protein
MKRGNVREFGAQAVVIRPIPLPAVAGTHCAAPTPGAAADLTGHGACSFSSNC